MLDLVNTVMKLRVPYRLVEWLSASEEIYSTEFS